MTENNGVLVTIGKNGWTVTKPNEHREDGSVSRRGTVQGYGDGWKKYIESGTPVVDQRTIPSEKLMKWVLQSPSVDPDLKGIRGAKVEANLDGLDERDDFWMVGMMPANMQVLALTSNFQQVSVEEFCLLAKEWGATVTRYEGEANG